MSKILAKWTLEIYLTFGLGYLVFEILISKLALHFYLLSEVARLEFFASLFIVFVCRTFRPLYMPQCGQVMCGGILF